MSDRDCHHGEQPSTCYRCELEQRVYVLEAAIREVLPLLQIQVAIRAEVGDQIWRARRVLEAVLPSTQARRAGR